jgi:hypothetical protein
VNKLLHEHRIGHGNRGNQFAKVSNENLASSTTGQA